jgi:hypothetical protein
MLRGRFGDTSGRPYFEGRLLLLGLKTLGDISFLVDTGADRSVLHPGDGERIGVDYEKLTHKTESTGIGGICHGFLEPALVVFSEPGRNLYVYLIPIEIVPPEEHIMELPSIIGRDILDRWRTVYDPTNNELTFEVHAADRIVPLTP